MLVGRLTTMGITLRREEFTDEIKDFFADSEVLSHPAASLMAPSKLLYPYHRSAPTKHCENSRHKMAAKGGLRSARYSCTVEV